MYLNCRTEHETLHISLDGDYLLCQDDAAWDEVSAKQQKKDIRRIVISGSKIGCWDSTLVAFLYQILKQAKQRQQSVKYTSFPKNLQRLLNLATAVERKPSLPEVKKVSLLQALGESGLAIYNSTHKGLNFIQTCARSVKNLLLGRAVMRWVDFMFALGDCSYRAVGIVSLVSFMVGLILAFVGAVQLKVFGAQIYVASLVAIGMTRIMGAIMMGIIMAGRTGASYAATIGSMQANEEVDALRTMGIPVADFLVLPRILALTIAMPFLTLLADALGIVGGAAVGILMLDIAPSEYWKYTSDALNMTNFWVGIFHGFVFGVIIALCGCYYGINSGRNADSVGKATTSAVVSSIVWMIVATGIITWVFEALGI